MSVYSCHFPKFLRPSNTNECFLLVPPPLLEGSSQKVPLENFSGSYTAHVRGLFKDEWACAQRRWSLVFLLPPWFQDLSLPPGASSQAPHLPNTQADAPLSSPFPLISGFCSILSQKICKQERGIPWCEHGF